MFYYIITILAGILIDSVTNKRYLMLRKLYVLWLYVFLCFGYMTGADWRNYETMFYQGTYFDYDIGFSVLMTFLGKIITDFWLLTGIIKCIYLWSCIKLLKELTSRWITAVAIYIPVTLMFMLINNPFRFMIANIFVNFSFIFAIRNKYIWSLVLVLLSIPFHGTAAFVILFLPLIKFDIFAKLSKKTLAIIYVVVLGLTVSVTLISFLQEFVSTLYAMYGARDYDSYVVQSNDNIFTIGSLISILLFILILWKKELITSLTPNGKVIFNMTMAYFYFSRLVSIVPTGFRLAIPLSAFYIVCLTIIIIRSQAPKYILILYFMATTIKSCYDSPWFIPYSNSIYYIAKGHKPYSERFVYNLNEYHKRTGKTVYMRGQ